MKLLHLKRIRNVSVQVLLVMPTIRFLLIAIFTLLNLINLPLYAKQDLVYAKQYSVKTSYNKTAVSDNGGWSIHAGVQFENKLNIQAGYKTLGTLNYQENFGVLNYNQTQLETSLGYSLIDSNLIQVTPKIGTSIGLSSVTLSNPPTGHDGFIARAFYPTITAAIESHLYLHSMISLYAGYNLQSPSLMGDQPWLNHWYSGIAFTIGKQKAFKSHLVFDEKVSTLNIMKKISNCYLCEPQFYSLFLGSFDSSAQLLSALEQPRINALLSTYYYLSSPHAFFVAQENGRLFLYFGEFKKQSQVKKWQHIWNSEIFLSTKVNWVSFARSQSAQMVKPLSTLY